MKKIALSELVEELESGNRPKGGVDSVGDIWSLGAEHLDENGGFKLLKPKLIPRKYYNLMTTGKIKKDDILIVKDGATTGKVSFVNGKFPFHEAAINEHVFRVKIRNDKAFPAFVFHFLSSAQGKAQILRDFRGATVGGISRAFVDKVELPAISITEQKRIAAILDKADAIRRKRQEAIKLCDEFLRSVFLDMFGDPVTNPKKFKIATIRDLISEAKYGTSGKAGSGGDFEILRMNNLTYSGKLDLKNVKYIDIAPKDQDKYLVRRGDLLFNRTNSKELVGKTAVYTQDEPRALAGYLIRVRPNSVGNTHYIAGYLNSEHGKQTLQSMCKSIIGMANINAQELQDIKILAPPVELQNNFAEIVEAVNEREESFKLALNEINLACDALSQLAFRGEL